MTDTRLDGASPATVRDALAAEDPLPGTAGFAGRVDDWLVRDVLGRRPVFVDATDPERWAFDPAEVAEPELLPAGCRLPVGEPVAAAETVWSLPDPDPRRREEAVAAVERAIHERVLVSSAPAAVAFSGGVDSAVVAAGRPDAPLYVAGFDDCHDVTAAHEAATAADRADDLQTVELDHETLREAVRAVVAATGRSNPMDVSIAVPLFCVAERAAADGHDRLAVGQGADELFGGYAKVRTPETDDRVDATTVRGARRETVLSLPEQLARDVVTLRAAGVEPVAPFLHDDVIAAALRLPDDALVADGVEGAALREAADGVEGAALREAADRVGKAALREAAAGVVPETARVADKKAVQYGTYVSRELDRLARRAGFKRRMNDHVGRYVAALAAGDLERG